ncbi:MucBP domain-containing protein, partial [Leuconostoc gelidum subsp. gelidum]|uniref:lectin-like domain-containing protein n=1 Tax=Leuconostoc gelidum TaxID=1244 RepID=UPI001CC59A5D
MKKKVQKNYRETKLVTRFKMYKDGKNWVTSGVSKLLSWVNSSQDNERSVNSKKNKHTEGTIFKALASVSALIGGSAVVSQEVFADTDNTATEKSIDNVGTVVNKDQVVLPNQTVSNQDSVLNKTSTSENKSFSVSSSESVSTSESISDSESVSTSESISNSESISTSESASHTEVASASDSTSNSVPTSTSEKTSDTQASAISESASNSESTITSTNVSNTSNASSNAIKNVSETKSVQVNYKTVVQAYAADIGDKVTVTKDNFLEYFTLNGSATYDDSDGTVTLTTNDNRLVGNFALKSKIDMNQSFTLKGQVNLGSDVNGADGIGFAFHDGNTTDVGQFGGNLGIGGLQNAIGFKLDTYRNNVQNPSTTGDATNQFGWAADPSTPNSKFGGFVNTTYKNVAGFDRWWAETDTTSVQNLNNDDLNGQFHDFTINYDGGTKLLTISYLNTDGRLMTWHETVNSASKAMAMIVSASTGGSKNLQQFRIDSFDYYQAATVNVKYVDEQGNEIATGAANYPEGTYQGKSYTTDQKEISGYTFVRMDSGSVPTSGILNAWGDNGTVIYVYKNLASESSSESA